MAIDVILPALGMAQETGTVLEWLKAEGEPIRAGEVLAIIETDKATLDLEAPADGVLGQILVPAGTEVPVGRVIATIVSAANTASASPASTHEKRQSEPRMPSADSSTGRQDPEPPRLRREGAEDGGQEPHAPTATDSLPGASGEGPEPGGRVAASPKARRLAAEQGIRLEGVRGSGPGGAVLAADLSRPAATPHSMQAAGSELSTIWRLMAERTTAAWTTTPHFFLVREVNASALRRWHEQLLASGSQEITLTDLLVKAAAEALVLHPGVRAAWREGGIVHREGANIGLAVASDDGLVAPVIHGADGLSIEEIALRRRELVGRARAGRLRPHDLEGGTFTISNLGMYGVDAFNAILNDGQAAILAVGRMADRVVPLNGQIAIQPMMTLTLSCDHRVVDGARGAQFLATLAERLELDRQ